MEQHPTHFLVIDDDPDERYLIERAVRNAARDTDTIVGISSGNEAIRYFVGEPPFENRKAFPFPSFLITDLRMPDGDGFEVLDFLRRNPGWSVVPKVVCTCSDDPDDVRTAFFLGAHAYHQKPISGTHLDECIVQLVTYWRTCVVPAVDEHGRIMRTSQAGKLGERFQVPQPGERMVWPDGTG